MKYFKAAYWAYKYLPTSLKEKIGRHEILKGPLIEEIQKLPIIKSGVSDDCFPWVALSNGLKFYGFQTSINEKIFYSFLNKKIKGKLIEESFSVAMDIVTRYVYPHALPTEVPPYSQFNRRAFHLQHRDTIQDLPHLTYDSKRKLLDLFSIKEGEICVDVGSYIGYGAIKIGRLVNSTGKVIAIEADPECRLLLEKNVRENSLDNIKIIPMAAWNKKGTVLLNKTYKQANSLIRSIVNGINNVIKVQADTLDNIIDSIKINNISLISLTINGAELEAIEGMSKTLEVFSPRLSIAGWHLRKGHPIWKKIVYLLKEKGYKSIVGKKGRVLAWKEAYSDNRT